MYNCSVFASALYLPCVHTKLLSSTYRESTTTYLSQSVVYTMDTQLHEHAVVELFATLVLRNRAQVLYLKEKGKGKKGRVINNHRQHLGWL